MSNNTGTENACVHWTGSKDHSCLKNGATKISCVLDKGYNSLKELKKQFDKIEYQNLLNNNNWNAEY